MKLVNTKDFEVKAKEILPEAIYQYFSSGANREITLRRNKDKFNEILLNP